MHRKVLSTLNCLQALFLILLMVLVGACSESEDIRSMNSTYNSLRELKPVDSLVLALDYETTPDLRVIEVTKEQGESYLYFDVLYRNLIKKYSLDDGHFVSTFDFKMDEPSSLGDDVICQHITSDTLLCVDDVGMLELIPYQDQGGEIRGLSSQGFEYQSKIQFDPTLMPAIRTANSNFILPNYFTWDHNERMLAKVNFDTRNVTWHLLPPKKYIDGYTAFHRFAFWNYVYQEQGELLLFNFPNLDSIYVYNLDFHLVEKNGLSSILKHKPNDRLYKEETRALAAKNNITTNILEGRAKQQIIYEALLYNDKKEHYYRFVGLPIPQNLIDLEESVKSDIRNYSLIVADSELNHEQEYSIPYNYYDLELKAYFIHDGKLYIQRKIDSEDEIIVDIFDI